MTKKLPKTLRAQLAEAQNERDEARELVRRVAAAVFGALPGTERPRPVIARLLSCSFCAKNQNDAKILIAAQPIFICDECVGVCNEIIAADAATSVAAVDPVVVNSQEPSTRVSSSSDTSSRGDQEP